VDGDGECDYDDKGEDEKERHKVESGECDLVGPAALRRASGPSDAKPRSLSHCPSSSGHRTSSIDHALHEVLRSDSSLDLMDQNGYKHEHEYEHKNTTTNAKITLDEDENVDEHGHENGVEHESEHAGGYEDDDDNEDEHEDAHDEDHEDEDSDGDGHTYADA